MHLIVLKFQIKFLIPCPTKFKTPRFGRWFEFWVFSVRYSAPKSFKLSIYVFLYILIKSCTIRALIPICTFNLLTKFYNLSFTNFGLFPKFTLVLNWYKWLPSISLATIALFLIHRKKFLFLNLFLQWFEPAAASTIHRVWILMST